MKRYDFVLVLVAMMGLVHTSFGQEVDKPRMIEIMFVNWSTITMVPIPCGALSAEGNLPIDGRILILQSDTFFSSMAKELKSLQKAEQKEKPDVRIRAVMYYGIGRPKVLCVGANETMVLDGNPMKYRPSLEKLLRSAIPLSNLDD